MTVQEWLGDNQLGIDIWEKKYMVLCQDLAQVKMRNLSSS